MNVCCLAKPSPEESQEEEMELFKKLYIEWKGEEHLHDPQYKAIPRFYFKVYTSDWLVQLCLSQSLVVKMHIAYSIWYVICSYLLACYRNERQVGRKTQLLMDIRRLDRFLNYRNDAQYVHAVCQWCMAMFCDNTSLLIVVLAAFW